jgi:glycosyltransferase involved in cell wall biosynthesis
LKILLITNKSLPLGLAPAERIRCYVNMLVKKSHNIIIYSYHEKSENKIAADFFNNLADLHFYKPSTVNFKSFLIDVINSREKFEIVLVYGFTVNQQVKILNLFKSLNIKVILEFNELPYSGERTRFDRVINLKYLKRVYFRMKSLPKFDGIISISENLKSYAIKYNEKAKQIKLPILFLTAQEEVFRPEKAKIDISHPFILHAGSISHVKDGIVNMVESFCLANIKLQMEGKLPIKLYLTNFVAIKSTRYKIKRLLNKYNQNDNFFITGYLNESELKFYQRHAIFHLVLKPHNLQNRYNFSTKIGECLNSGVPIILGSVENEVNYYIKDRFDAILVNPNDSNVICKAMIELYDNKNLRSFIGKNGKKLAVEQFESRNYISKFDEFLNNVLLH